MPAPIDIFITKLLAYKTIIAQTPSKEKEGQVSKQLADQFNTMLEGIATEWPELAPSLPTRIAARSQLSRRMALTDFKFVELAIVVEQVLGLLNLYKSKR
jgi:hypothetical protein